MREGEREGGRRKRVIRLRARGRANEKEREREVEAGREGRRAYGGWRTRKTSGRRSIGRSEVCRVC